MGILNLARFRVFTSSLQKKVYFKYFFLRNLYCLYKNGLHHAQTIHIYTKVARKKSKYFKFDGHLVF